MDDNDLLETNQYIVSTNQQSTYGVQKNLSDFLFDEHLSREHGKRVISQDDSGISLDDTIADDILLTNSITEGFQTHPTSCRVTREIRELVVIDSSRRQLTQETLV